MTANTNKNSTMQQMLPLEIKTIELENKAYNDILEQVKRETINTKNAPNSSKSENKEQASGIGIIIGAFFFLILLIAALAFILTS